jgi:hypothetical protein
MHGSLIKETSVTDPDTGSGKEKNLDSGSGMNIPDHIPDDLEKIFRLKIV